MRCKACNSILTPDEMVLREETGEFDELCLTCRKASEDEVEWEVRVAYGLIKQKYPMKGEEWDD